MFSLTPEQASTVAGQVDALYYFLLALTVFFFVLIGGLILRFAVKYRRRTADEVGAPITGSLSLETMWSVIPFLVVMVIFFWGARVYVSIYHVPADALEIYVVGKQWMWKFQHLDGQREINELHVPVGRAVKLVMSSQDVIHSFYVPAFRVKADAIPGYFRTVWFQATKPGTYHLFCAEYCGTQHSGMIGRVVVMEPQHYQAWLSGRPAEGSADLSPAAAGQKLFQELACHTCHHDDVQGIGPRLAGLYGTSVRLQGGQLVTVDEQYIRESILNPMAKITAGFQPVMPSYQGRVNEEQLLELLAYIRSLGSPSAPATEAPSPSQGTEHPS